MYYEVLVGGMGFKGSDALTYSSEDSLQPGQIVAISLRSRLTIGIVERTVPKPDFAAKPISRSWDIVLPLSSLKLLGWIRAYYPSALGSIVELFLPSDLPQKLTIEAASITSKPVKPADLPKLTGPQTKALKTIEATKGSLLLHGDTGSGKTRVYLEVMHSQLMLGKSVMILTPEIGLTQPLFQELQRWFGERVLLTHSEMTPAQRRKVWLQVLTSPEPLVIVGPRSALFLPVRELGLVVIDEFHDSAYKQEQAPYYLASRVGAQLARLHDARLILGSATPPVVDYFTFITKDLPIIRMAGIAQQSEHTVQRHIIDLSDRNQFKRSAYLSDELIKALELVLSRGEQSLIFLNRRGTARLVLCENCGWQALCPRCDIALTYHNDTFSMLCHTCGYSDQVPSSCPTCHASELIFKTIGTKGLETELKRLLPRARIARYDRDTKRTERLQHQFDQLHAGDIDIVIGTQTISKGFDLPKLALVGIVQADSGMQIPDFSATERTFQLISQVAGRIGRGFRSGELYLQTYHPDSPLLEWALEKDYTSFYEHELIGREQFNFPPATFLLKLTCSGKTSDKARQKTDKILAAISSIKEISVVGPSPRFKEKIAGSYGWQLVVRSRRRSKLLEVIAALPRGTSYDLDPIDLL